MANILALPLILAALAQPSLQKSTYTLTPPDALSEAAEPREPTSLAVRDLVVMSYNVHGLPWPFAGKRREAIRTIGRDLAALRAAGKAPDIVLIQENFDDPDELIAASGYKFVAAGPDKHVRPSGPRAKGFARTRYLFSGEGWGKLTSSGLYILSDLPITATTTDAYRYCAGFDCLANKGVMMVHVEVPGLASGLDVVNTHMNADRSAARVSSRRSLKAHNLQTEELNRFVARARTPGAPLLVGGDFNVKNDPERYYHQAEARAFTVVSEYCLETGCALGPGAGQPRPWLASQDLQAFSAGGPASIRPLEASALFDGANQARLSDHDGYVVRYRLGWRTAGN